MGKLKNEWNNEGNETSLKRMNEENWFSNPFI